MLRRFIKAVLDLSWKEKVLLEMRDVFKEVGFMVERNVIEEHEMLVQLTHVANVGYEGQAEFPCHHADRQKFAYTRKPGAVCLHEVHRSILHKVLEENTVWNMLTRGDFYGGDIPRQDGMRVYIVRMRRLLNPEWCMLCEFAGHANRCGQIPVLVRVKHQNAGVACGLAQYCGTAQIA
jgi:hypothetical protein